MFSFDRRIQSQTKNRYLGCPRKRDCLCNLIIRDMRHGFDPIFIKMRAIRSKDRCIREFSPDSFHNSDCLICGSVIIAFKY